jgi:protoheme IX farnesyltransferase
VVGDQATRWRSLAYTLALVPVTLAPIGLGYLGMGYGVFAVVSGIWFTWLVGRSLVEREPSFDYRVFKGSIVYLSILFLAMLVDLAIPWGAA